eukprot:13842499-Ditylum_brightwellii.AAC.1
MASKPTSSAASFRLFLLTLMVVQNSSVVLLGRYSRSSSGKSEIEEEKIFKRNFVCPSNFPWKNVIAQLVFSAILEYNVTKGQLIKSIKENIIDVPLDFLRILVPSLLYLVQNTLLYVALSNLSAPLFQVTYQTKVLTTALVSVVMLNRRYSFKQWVCLFFLGIGVAVVLLGESHANQSSEETEEADADAEEKEESDKPEQSLFIGLVSVLIACLSSALAGVYFEK